MLIIPAAGQTWVLGNKWGLPDGDMLHTSYGMAALLHVMTEEVDGITQGGVYRFPFRFATGVMRAAFARPTASSISRGLRGWQTAGVKDGALQRVRYTGKPAASTRVPAHPRQWHSSLLHLPTRPQDRRRRRVV